MPRIVGEGQELQEASHSLLLRRREGGKPGRVSIRGTQACDQSLADRRSPVEMPDDVIRQCRQIVSPRRCVEIANTPVERLHVLVGSGVKVRIKGRRDAMVIEAVASAMNIPMDRVYNNIERYGNTGAASVPMALHEAAESGLLKEGDLVLLAAFGTGFSWGAVLLRW